MENNLICKDYDGNIVEVHDFLSEEGASRVTIILEDIDGFDVDDYSFNKDLGEWDSFSIAKVIDTEELKLKYLVSLFYTLIQETDEEEATNEADEEKETDEEIQETEGEK